MTWRGHATIFITNLSVPHTAKYLIRDKNYTWFYLHTDDAPSPATVLAFWHGDVAAAEGIKAQDPSDTVTYQTNLSNQHKHVPQIRDESELSAIFKFRFVHDEKSHKDTDLAREHGAFQRFDEVSVHLIGSHYNRGHGILVLRGGRGQQR